MSDRLNSDTKKALGIAGGTIGTVLVITAVLSVITPIVGGVIFVALLLHGLNQQSPEAGREKVEAVLAALHYKSLPGYDAKQSSIVTEEQGSALDINNPTYADLIYTSNQVHLRVPKVLTAQGWTCATFEVPSLLRDEARQRYGTSKVDGSCEKAGQPAVGIYYTGGSEVRIKIGSDRSDPYEARSNYVYCLSDAPNPYEDADCSKVFKEESAKLDEDTEYCTAPGGFDENGKCPEDDSTFSSQASDQ